MNYIIATIRPWNISFFKKYFGRKKNFHLIARKEDLTLNKIKKINPRYIFVPHWSWIIPEEIWSNFECVVFHMTDLPYGRGGSPLQNLIVRGHKRTKITALKVDGGLDTGPVYLKRKLSLFGTAEEIYIRASEMIFGEMIPLIAKSNPKPKPQKGKIVSFKRRKPEDGKILETMPMEEIYDIVRMLDAPEYPKAFIEGEKWRMEFSEAEKTKTGLKVSVEIKEK
ncbi:MAG: formyltransferase family protein [Patescibacteria group bacterium]